LDDTFAMSISVSHFPAKPAPAMISESAEKQRRQGRRRDREEEKLLQTQLIHGTPPWDGIRENARAPRPLRRTGVSSCMVRALNLA
jgi:hypothetical protein